MTTILSASFVAVYVRDDAKELWVNVDGARVLHVCQIDGPVTVQHLGVMPEPLDCTAAASHSVSALALDAPLRRDIDRLLDNASSVSEDASLENNHKSSSGSASNSGL